MLQISLEGVVCTVSEYRGCVNHIRRHEKHSFESAGQRRWLNDFEGLIYFRLTYREASNAL